MASLHKIKKTSNHQYSKKIRCFAIYVYFGLLHKAHVTFLHVKLIMKTKKWCFRLFYYVYITVKTLRCLVRTKVSKRLMNMEEVYFWPPMTSEVKCKFGHMIRFTSRTSILSFKKICCVSTSVFDLHYLKGQKFEFRLSRIINGHFLLLL